MCVRRGQRYPDGEERRGWYSLFGLMRGRGPVDPLPRSDGGDDRRQQHEREGAISRYRSDPQPPPPHPKRQRTSTQIAKPRRNTDSETWGTRCERVRSKQRQMERIEGERTTQKGENEREMRAGQERMRETRLKGGRKRDIRARRERARERGKGNKTRTKMGQEKKPEKSRAWTGRRHETSRTSARRRDDRERKRKVILTPASRGHPSPSQHAPSSSILGPGCRSGRSSSSSSSGCCKGDLWEKE